MSDERITLSIFLFRKAQMTICCLLLWMSTTLAATPSTDSFWGVAPSASLSYAPAVWLPAMAEAGVGSVRSLYAPTSNGEDRLAPITAAGLTGVGILKWSAGSTSTFPVDDLAGWRAYVKSQVTRYKGRIGYWEVWNEPPNFTADKSPASYAKIVAAAFDAAKEIDPTVQIGLAAKSNHLPWLSETIAGGAAGKFDFVTLHPYEVAAMLPNGWEGQYMSIVPNVRKMLRAVDPGKADVPVWFTEIGIPADASAAGGVGAPMQADVLVKIQTMALAQGVGRTFWFDPKDSEGLTMGLTTSDGTKRPAWHALRSLKSQLGARPDYAGWIRPENTAHGFVFRSDSTVVLIAWSPAGQTARLTFSSNVTSIDPYTGVSATVRTADIVGKPLLLVAPIGSIQADRWLAESSVNTGKAVHWNSDRSASTSVSLIAGETPDGVFMVNQPKTTMFNGVAEMGLGGQSGASFAVDPAFLPFATTPIRITAVVRGHGEGNPGFNLKYESDAPIASADQNGLVSSSTGWFQVKGTGYQEKTWVLPNARFFGKYGYNFRLDTDGTAHSKFSIVRVTVSR